MNFSQIQRRAFLIASATMAGVVALVLCYWQAVSKRALPSPLQPMMVSPAPAPVSQRADVSARAPARPVVPAPTPVGTGSAAITKSIAKPATAPAPAVAIAPLPVAAPAALRAEHPDDSRPALSMSS